MPEKTASKSIAAKDPAQKATRTKSAAATSRKRPVKAASTAKPKAKAAPKRSAAKKSTASGRAVKHTRTTVQPVAAVKPAAALDPAAYHEAVARLAYHLWERKGRPEGSSELDWRQAEQEIGIGRRI